MQPSTASQTGSPHFLSRPLVYYPSKIRVSSTHSLLFLHIVLWVLAVPLLNSTFPTTNSSWKKFYGDNFPFFTNFFLPNEPVKKAISIKHHVLSPFSSATYGIFYRRADNIYKEPAQASSALDLLVVGKTSVLESYHDGTSEQFPLWDPCPHCLCLTEPLDGNFCSNNSWPKTQHYHCRHHLPK